MLITFFQTSKSITQNFLYLRIAFNLIISFYKVILALIKNTTSSSYFENYSATINYLTKLFLHTGICYFYTK